jgi:hypothetical protein
MSRANIKESKNKSEGFVHLIMYGKEARLPLFLHRDLQMNILLALSQYKT